MKNEQEEPCRDRDWFSRSSWAKEQTRSAIGYHVTFRLADDGGIARTPATLRFASQLILRCGENRGLVTHRLADNHGHTLLLATREQAGTFANVVEGMLRKKLRLRVPFQPCRIRPIENERHLGRSLPYVYRQEEHHGTCFDALHDGSSLPELLGMRMGSPWVASRVRSAVPRLARTSLLDWLGAPGLDDEAMDVRHLADAASGAWGVGSLRGKSVRHIRARRVAVHVFERLAPDGCAASTLEIPGRSVRRYRAEAVSAAEIRAVELQLKLRSHIDKRRNIVVLDA
jgi:ferredoxin-thioredoxin reductase catalytic subunit